MRRNPTLNNGTVHPKKKVAKEKERAMGFMQYQTNYSEERLCIQGIQKKQVTQKAGDTKGSLHELWN